MAVWLTIISLILGSLLATGAWAGVVTTLPTKEKVVALTFDACETKTPAFFDEQIIQFLLEQQLPCTLFVTGKFARRNQEQLSQLAQFDWVEIENHSLTHPQHLERLDTNRVRKEVLENEQLLFELTNRKTKFFRFPAGNYDHKTLTLIESLGYQTVHWTFPSGDPDKKLTAPKLISWVLAKTRPGAILIFHINGRGYQTGAALPAIITGLKERGYRFVNLEEMLAGAKEE